MFGNLFGTKPPSDNGTPPTPPDAPQPDASIVPPPVDQMQQGAPQQQSQPDTSSVGHLQAPDAQNQQPTPTSQDGSQQQQQQASSGPLGSRMDPAFRQNLSALSHLDQRTTQVLLHAQEETKRIHQQIIEPEQILVGLLYDEGVFKLLEEFAIDVAGLLREVQSKEAPGKYTGQPMLSNDSQQLFEKSYLETKKREAAFVTPEDLLLTILAGNNKATGFLNAKGLKKEKIEEKLTKSTQYNFGKKSVLEKFGVDLTEEARQGKLDPIAGRDKEIERMIHIILRRTKNNPIIIGEAGVGKTAVVEGLAQAIAGGTIPDALRNKRVIQLDMASLVAGASHRGEFEERLRGVINEAMASTGQLVLFIDEIHTVMGAGDDGAMDAANIIKPNLARGKLQIIGATTTAEYRKYFEKDKAFERRFQPIIVDEPDEANAIKMLQVLRPKFEKFHNVTITDEALEASVKLSKKYIGERYLPDKAIDLLDEASAEVKLAHSDGNGMTYTKQNEEDTFQARIAKAKDKGDKAEVLGADGKIIEEKKDEEKKDPAAKDATKKDDKTQDPNSPKTENNLTPAQQDQNMPNTQGQPQQWANPTGQMPGGVNAQAMNGSYQSGSINAQQPAWNGVSTNVASNQPQYAAYQVPGTQPNGMNSMPQQTNQFSPMQGMPGQGTQALPNSQSALGPDGNSLPQQMNGQLMLGSDGNPIPQQANGQPMLGPDGNPMPQQMNSQPMIGPDGNPLPQQVNGQPAIPGQNPDQNQNGQNPKDPNTKDAVPADPNSPKTADGVTDPNSPKEAKHEGSGPEVSKTDIENVVSNWTGIPITKLTEDESEKLLKLEDRIHQRLIDQEEAVKAVSEAVRRGRIGLASGNRPIASFIFLGPTGTGKTELAKTLAEILFGKDDAMVRLDMSEYMEKHEVAKLIGAPPGYVGYEEGGQLTEAVRAKPYSIVLLDEVEKAHPDVFNILLQLLEDGRLTDNKGNTISFKNTIIICTSNIGSALITQSLTDKDTKVQKTPEQEDKEFKELSGQVNEELRKFFRPELLNRYDDIVIFKPLRKQDMGKIAKLGLDKTAKLLREQGYALQVTENALAQIALEGFDPVYGARPLRRLIQTSIENPIALALISKQFAAGDTLVIDYDAPNSKYVFKQGEKKKELQEAFAKDSKDDKDKKDGEVTADAGKVPGMSAPDGSLPPVVDGQVPNGTPTQYPDWVQQALQENGQTPQNPNQPGGNGMAQQVPGSQDLTQSNGQAQVAPTQPAPSLVDQMTQPAVEAPFDPLALVGSTPPAQSTQPTDTFQPTAGGQMMQRAD